MSWASNHPTVRRLQQTSPLATTPKPKSELDSARGILQMKIISLENLADRIAATVSFAAQDRLKVQQEIAQKGVDYWKARVAELEAQEGGGQ
ncbi:hypothetical protein [Xanthomonas maliensis]|uniref:hypothetical protein n=1 Tax=Xanthomonas maliensis TaxID=1321368 RepID=UPI0003B5B9DE|nr:hypothetical protein [Xanthomonas maliensis]KAB7769332.1 hypothetical protein CKY51_07025 [Xanthomonas maliensis]